MAQVGNTAAGETNSASFTLEPGEYQVICTIAGHFDAGMRGTVSASCPAAPDTRRDRRGARTP